MGDAIENRRIRWSYPFQVTEGNGGDVTEIGESSCIGEVIDRFAEQSSAILEGSRNRLAPLVIGAIAIRPCKTSEETQHRATLR